MADPLDDLFDTPAPTKRRAPADYKSLYQEVGARHGVDPDLLYRQAKQESSLNPRAVGPQTKYGQAKGMAQFIPTTAREYGMVVNDKQDDRLDPVKAADAQARLMKKLITRYGDEKLALSAYNSGTNRSPQSARRAMERIPETRNYVQRITGGRTQRPAAPDPLSDLFDAPEQPAQPAPTPRPTRQRPARPVADTSPFAGVQSGVDTNIKTGVRVGRERRPSKIEQDAERGQALALPKRQGLADANQLVSDAVHSPEAEARSEIKRQVKAERLTNPRVPFPVPTAIGGIPSFTTPRAALKSLEGVLSPVTTAMNLTKSEDELVAEEVDSRREAQKRAVTPEVLDIRKEYGEMSAPARAVAQPLVRAGAGLLKMGGGISSLAGLAPNKLSDWMNARGSIVEEGAALAPLTPEGEEVVKGIPEKVVAGLGDVGLTVFQIVALKKATGLPMGQLMAAETALKTSDMPAGERSAKVAEAFAMGKVLESHLGRTASAVSFGAPTAVQTANQVVEGKMSIEDALINTGVQAGSGFALGGKGLTTGGRRARETKSPQQPAEVTTAPSPEPATRPAEIPQTGGATATTSPLPAGERRHQPFADRMMPENKVEVPDALKKSSDMTAEQFIERRKAERREQAAKTDEITGLRTSSEWAKAKDRIGEDTTREVAYLDANFLKKLNDEHGHDVGDRYLGHIGKVIKEEAAKLGISDRQVFRAGGDEFAIDVPKGQGQQLVDAIKARVGEFNEKGVRGEIAGGVGEHARAADKAMFADKAAMKARTPTEVNPSATKEVIPETSESQLGKEDTPNVSTSVNPETLKQNQPTLSDGKGVEASAPKPEPSTASARKTQGSKEPWEMTREEFVSDPQEQFRRGETLRRSEHDAESEYGKDLSRDAHRGRVEQALKQGKTVPPEVLAEYPELRPPSSATASAPKEPSATAPKVVKREDLLDSPTTSARSVQMARDRAELDLPELPSAERKSWQQSLSEAKPERAGLLADEVLTKPRSLSDSETASLVVRAQEIKNEHAARMKEIGEATTPESIEAKKGEVEALEREFDKLTKATKASGTEKGRTLAAQKLTINQDFDLISVVQRMKKAKGRELTTEERTRYEQQTTKISELETKLAEANDRAKSNELQREIDKAKRSSRRAESKEALDDEFASLRSQFAQARIEVPRVQASGLAGLDPEGKLTILIAKMAKNRVKAGVNKADALVDQVYSAIKEHVPGITPRDIRDAISGYGLEPKGDRRNETAKQLASLRTQLKQLSAQEDIAAGKQLAPRDKTRQNQLLKQEAELQRRLDEKDFSPNGKRPAPKYTRETFALQRRIDEIKKQFGDEQYRATRSTGGKVVDTVSVFGNLPKTLLTIGDVSALGRQGFHGVVTHPILSAGAAKQMVKSITERGWANVEAEIKAHPEFESAKRDGKVEFTGVDKADPRLSKHEEGYLGGSAIDTIATGKYNPFRLLKGVKDVSERTFVSFLDSQRMAIYAHQSKAIHDMKLSPEQTKAALKAQGYLINISSGRGDLGVRGNQAAPILNMAFFSPRLVASRVQLLNKMLNPVAMARTPKGARKLLIQDNVKFLSFVGMTLGLVKASGIAAVSLDPDDSEFLKMKIGNTRLDMLAGLQQPTRFMLRLASAVKAGVIGDETYAGENKGKIVTDFTRSKASPEAGYLWDYLEGKNRLTGKKFEAGKDLVKTVTPLPFQDFHEAIKVDGALRGSIEAFPSLLGIGTQTYKGAAEKPGTQAEKLTRRLVMRKLPDSARTQEEIDQSAKTSELRARSRRGEDVSKEVGELLKAGTLTREKAQNIIKARNQSRFIEDLKHLGADDALTVYRVMSADEKKAALPLILSKMRNSEAPAPQKQKFMQKARTLGVIAP